MPHGCHLDATCMPLGCHLDDNWITIQLSAVCAIFLSNQFLETDFNIANILTTLFDVKCHCMSPYVIVLPINTVNINHYWNKAIKHTNDNSNNTWN